MNTAIILDTNVIILYLKGNSAAVNTIQKYVLEKTDFFVSAISLAELLAFPNLNKKDEQNIFDFLSFMTVSAVDEHIAIEAAKLCRGEKLRLGDSIIAATALVSGGKLLTADKRLSKLKSVGTEIIKI